MPEQAASFQPSDRLGLMLFLAALFHLALILGISFVPPRRTPVAEGLDVTLIQTQTRRRPVDAHLLAQTNAAGGGTVARHVHLQSPFPVHQLRPQGAHLPSASAARSEVHPAIHLHFLTAPSSYATDTPHTHSNRKPLPQTQPHSGVVNIAALDEERAQLSAQLSRSWQTFEHQPRERYISVRTRASRYARYMEAWKSHVEHIGNTHYPERLMRNHVRGRVVVDVAINADGSVHAVRIVGGSTAPELAAAARRIVQLAAPFAPFPPNIRSQADILHITRTWNFRGRSLTTAGAP
ncbi:MAG TPA: energy transducer TonB [Acidiferrobacteraceae bacterium]|nr:energy transducer TonB [Acidiferrobacteraceae bacterium]